jgi:electron transfer flavoprotein alpha subunit
MTILVPVKRVVDPYAKVKPLADGSGLDTAGVKFEINPFDEIALEEAVRIREKDASVTVVAISIGGAECEEQLRKALAIGADKAILIETSETYDSPSVAKELEAAVREINPDIILMGKQATDDDCNQAGQMLAARLDWPQATFASKIELGSGSVKVTRETDTGEETLEVLTPCLITADLRLNEPRYVALPGIIKARSKPLEKRPAKTTPQPKTRRVKLEPAPSRSAGRGTEGKGGARVSRTLIIAFEPHEYGALAGFAQALGFPYDLLQLKGEVSGEFGAEKAFVAGASEVPPADALAKALSGRTSGYSHIAAVSSMQSKDAMARLAGLIDAAMVTDAIGIDSPTVFRRPIVAGSIIETVEVLATPVVLTIRPAGFPKATPGGATSQESFSLSGDSKAQRISVTARSGGRPDLSQAKVVVSGGRPLKDAETFERVLGGLADALGGAVGATRAAVDSGIAPNELQVGQTGKIVAPDLYIAAGVSGSTQHMAGIKDSKTIVAINKDPDAPIFEAADFGLVADLFDALPELQSKVGKQG